VVKKTISSEDVAALRYNITAFNYSNYIHVKASQYEHISLKEEYANCTLKSLSISRNA